MTLPPETAVKLIVKASFNSSVPLVEEVPGPYIEKLPAVVVCKLLLVPVAPKTSLFKTGILTFALVEVGVKSMSPTVAVKTIFPDELVIFTPFPASKLSTFDVMILIPAVLPEIVSVAAAVPN